jgi:phage gpG-like protein
MASLTVAAAEMREVARDIRRLDKNSLNMATVWRRAGSRIARDNRRQFATRGAFQGTPWKPLAASTLRQKLRGGGRRQMLRKTDALFRSFTGRPMDIEQIFAKEAHFGSSLQTAVWQQNGTFMNGKRHIPPRPILKLNDDTRREIIKMVVKQVMRGIG